METLSPVKSPELPKVDASPPPTLGPIEVSGELGLYGQARPGRKNQRAVLFVHGFTGQWETTWTNFPKLVLNDPDLAEYDVYTLGYRSSWFGGDSVDHVARQLDGLIERNLSGKQIVLIAHSLGGLVSMQYILLLLNRGRGRNLPVQGLLMYGTPTEGTDLVRAAKLSSLALGFKVPVVGRLMSWFLGQHRQITDLAPASALLTGQKDRWTAQVVNGGHATVDPTRRAWLLVGVVTGTKDIIVSEHSAKATYGEIEWSPLPFGHIELVKPTDHRDTRYRVAKKFLKDCTRIRYPEILFRLRQISDEILRTGEKQIDRDWKYDLEIGGDGSPIPAELREAGFQRCSIRTCRYKFVMMEPQVAVGVAFDAIASKEAWEKGPQYIHQITALETDSNDKTLLKGAFDHVVRSMKSQDAWATFFPEFQLAIRDMGSGDKSFEFDAPSHIEPVGSGLLGWFQLPLEWGLLVGNEVEIDFRYTSLVPRSLSSFHLMFPRLTYGCRVSLTVRGDLEYLIPPIRTGHEPAWKIQPASYADHVQVAIETDELVLPKTAPVTRWRYRPERPGRSKA